MTAAQQALGGRASSTSPAMCSRRTRAETLATLDVDELQQLLDVTPTLQVVDVRETTERDTGYIPGSRNIPYRLLRKLGCGALDRSKPVVTVCESGPRAAIAASLLAREGFDVRAVVARRHRRLRRRRRLVQALRRLTDSMR